MSAAEPKTSFDFMKVRFIFLGLSLLLIIFSTIVWDQRGSDKFGIDFLGGTDLVLQFKESVTAGQIRGALNSSGFTNVIVQAFESDDNEFSIRLKGKESNTVGKEITDALTQKGMNFELLKNDFVGPVIGEQIKSDGLFAVCLALVGLLIYVAWRFELRYGLGAILALSHDVFISAGVFIFLGGEIGASALAGLLTIVGYSVNDTIIIYDRIRENLQLQRRGKGAQIGSIALKNLNLKQILNLSINQTLSRTILTSGTTIFTCGSLWVLGGGAVSELASILTLGIVTGTYSSIIVAPSLILALERNRKSS